MLARHNEKVPAYNGQQGHEGYGGLVLVHDAGFPVAGDDGAEDALIVSCPVPVTWRMVPEIDWRLGDL